MHKDNNKATKTGSRREGWGAGQRDRKRKIRRGRRTKEQRKKQRYREKDGEMEKTVKIGMKCPAERWRNLKKTDRDHDGGRKRGTGRRTEDREIWGWGAQHKDRWRIKRTGNKPERLRKKGMQIRTKRWRREKWYWAAGQKWR